MQTTLSEGLLNKNELVRDIIQPARRRKRFFNYFLDAIFFYMIYFGVNIIWGSLMLLSGTAISSDNAITMVLFQNLLSLGLFIAYYVFFEHKFGKTIGKMVTNTKVTRKDGSKPTLTNIVGRTFSRFIPFEPFSLLFTHLPQGWHDSLSGTMVIDDIALYNIEKSKEKTEESF